MFSLSAKRPREDDLLDEEDTLRDIKKLCPLALRPQGSAYNLSNRFFAPSPRPPAITPNESDDDGGKSARALPASNPAINITETKTDLLANGDGLSPWQVPSNEHNIQSPSTSNNLVNHSLNITTPKYGEPPDLQSESTMETDTVQHMDQLASYRPGVEKSREAAWWHLRHLPGPISDDGSLAKSRCSTSDAEMTYNTSQPVSPFLNDHHGDSIQQTGLSSLDVPEKQPSRSPGMQSNKNVLAMGYRADCDKCRLKVPGHYSHIIRA